MLEESLAAGELGCIIDPKITKMVQTGLEKSLVPDTAGFLNLRMLAILFEHNIQLM
jgi:peroxin-6